MAWTPIDIFSLITTSATFGSAIAPIIVGPTFNTSQDQQNFMFDYYFKVWVIPDRLELRNPRTNVDIPFVIWNAFPYRNTLTSISSTGADGLDLDFSAGNMWREIEYRTVNITITPIAPLTIESAFTFTFTNGVGRFVFVADRATVLSILPDVPLSENWDWLTDIIVATDGTEQRAALRAVPRRSMSTKLVAITQDEIWANIKQAMFDFGNQVVIPYFQYSTTTTSDTPSGATVVQFDPKRTDLRVGEYVFVMSRTAQELLKIETLTGTGCTLDAPITIDLPKGSLVVPAFASVVNSPATIERYAVNDVADIRVDSVSSQSRADFKRPGSTTVLTTFQGYPVLDKRPLANSNVADNFDNGNERFDYSTGSIEQITRWLFTRVEGPREFMLKRVTVPADMDYWRDFLDTARGMLNPFLVPTFRQDLFIASRPVDRASNIIIAGSDYGSLFWPKAPYKRLYMWTDAGVYMVNVTEVFVNDDGNTVCTIDPPLPTGDKYRNVKFISFLLKCRLAQDSVSLEHYAMDTILKLSIRTVPE